MPGFFVGQEVQIPLSVPFFDIGEAVPFFRKGPEGLGQEAQVLGPDGNFTGAGLEEGAFDAQGIAGVQLLEDRVLIVGQLVAGDVDLNLARSVSQVDEGNLSHRTEPDDPSRHRHTAFGCAARGLCPMKKRYRLLYDVGPTVAGWIGVYALSKQPIDLCQTLAIYLFSSIGHMDCPRR